MSRTSRMDPLDPKPFLRTFSYREVLSAVMIATLLLAVRHTLSYLELYVSSIVLGIALFLMVIFLHVLYRLEHKRSNNFVGRMIHGSIYFAVFYVVVLTSRWYSTGEVVHLDMGLGIILLWVVLAIIEGMVALLRVLFEFIGWRIL
jgi:hypothetical protein